MVGSMDGESSRNRWRILVRSVDFISCMVYGSALWCARPTLANPLKCSERLDQGFGGDIYQQLVHVNSSILVDVLDVFQWFGLCLRNAVFPYA